jgi:hypothetical protein
MSLGAGTVRRRHGISRTYSRMGPTRPSIGLAGLSQRKTFIWRDPQVR